MTWYCGNCHFPNSVNDAYCCNCHRIKDDMAFKSGGLSPIAITNRPLTLHPPGYNTHDDSNHEHSNHEHSNHEHSNHEHCDASLSNELDPGFTSDHGTSAPSQDPHDGRWRKFWYCCYCRDGPHGSGNIPTCNCGHVHCGNCEMVWLKMKLNPLD